MLLLESKRTKCGRKVDGGHSMILKADPEPTHMS
jgi:hypothetical protein